MIKAYLANEYGFSETGQIVLKKIIHKLMKIKNLEIINPFLECSKEYYKDFVDTLELYEHRIAYHEKFNDKAGDINFNYLKDTDCLLAILDGGHAVDSGVSLEMGFYCALGLGPIFALRSDMRYGENIATSVNLMHEKAVQYSNGKLCKTIDDWIKSIKDWATKVS
jgi:nucleoside 2-deoxyribosyltransferase